MIFKIRWKTFQYLAFSLFLLPIIVYNSFAQILNVDRISISHDSSKTKNLNAVVNLGLDIHQEDATVINLSAGTDISYLFQKNVIIFLAEYDLTSAKNVNLINAGYSHLRFRFNRESIFQPELFTQYQWNGVRGMKSRFLAGTNLRFLLNKDSLNVSYFALGLMDEWETWDYRGVPVNKIPMNPREKQSSYLKLNCYFNIAWVIGEKVDLSFILYIQSRPNADIIYPRISPSMQIYFKMSDNLSVSFIFNGIYDRKPVVPIKKFFYDFSSVIIFLI